MTFTVLGRCQRTRRLGIAIATYSLAVGAYCPFFSRGNAVLSTQAFANPALGPVALQALAENSSPAQTMAMLAKTDPGFAYRQVAILAFEGDAIMHTGNNCRTWAGHQSETDCCAFGNVLAGPEIVEAMVGAFAERHREPLDERLLSALDAGRAAGGQKGSNGVALPERSAAIQIRGEDITEDLDLRVDSSDDAISALIELYAAYSPYMPYYALRARDPANTPAQDLWAEQNIGPSQ